MCILAFICTVIKSRKKSFNDSYWWPNCNSATIQGVMTIAFSLQLSLFSNCVLFYSFLSFLMQWTSVSSRNKVHNCQIGNLCSNLAYFKKPISLRSDTRFFFFSFFFGVSMALVHCLHDHKPFFLIKLSLKMGLTILFT